jgi:acetyl-CoA acyltransferase 1
MLYFGLLKIPRTAQPLVRAASTQTSSVVRMLQKNPNDVVITFAKRTAMGRASKGQFKDTPVDEMLCAFFKATLQKTELDPLNIDDICIGVCHLPSPLYVCRAAALAAGIPHQVPISTLNRLCSSGLMAIRSIAHAIQAGETSIGLAVGVENMSLKRVSCRKTLPLGVLIFLSRSPRPTPVVSAGVEKHPRANDCIQVCAH